MKNLGAHWLAGQIYSEKPYTLRDAKVARGIVASGKAKDGQRFSPERLQELCEKLNLDPCEVAVKGLSPEHAPDLKDKDRAEIALKLMEYLMPKRRAVELEAEVEVSYVVSGEPVTDDEWQKTYSVGTATGAAEGAD